MMRIAKQPRQRSTLYGERGQSFAEFALVLPILLLVTLGIFDFGRAFFTYAEASNRLRSALRFGAILGYDATLPNYANCDEMINLANNVMFDDAGSRIVITFLNDDTNPPSTLLTCDSKIGVYPTPQTIIDATENGDIIEITATAEVSMISPLFPRVLPITLVGQRTLVKEIILKSCGDGELDFTTENCINCPADWMAFWSEPIYVSEDEPEEKNPNPDPDLDEGSDEVFTCFVGPDDISGVVVSVVDDDVTVQLNWTQIDPALNPERLQIQRRTVNDAAIPREFGLWTTVVSNLPGDATTYTDVAPMLNDEDVKYQYRIRYFRELPLASENEEWSDYHYTTVVIPQDILVQIDAPEDIPTVIAAYPEVCEKITLEWTDNTNDETGWEIRRSINNPTMPASAFEITSDGDTDRGDLTGYQYFNPPNSIAHNNTYYFWVRAVNTAPNPDRFSAWLAFDPVTVDCPPTVPETPGIAAEWIATDVSTSTFTVSVRWTDDSTIETGFELYRSTSPSFPALESDWTLLETYDASVPATDTGASTLETYTDITSCGTWYFRIRALGPTTPADATISVTVLCSPVLNLTGCVTNTGGETPVSQKRFPKVAWDSIGGAQFYNLYAKVVSNPAWSFILQTPGQDCFGNQAAKCFGTSAQIPYSQGVAYNYRVNACKSVVWEGNNIEVCSLPSDGIGGNVAPGDALQCPAP